MKNKNLSFSFVITAMAVLFLSLLNPSKVNAQYYSTENKKEISIDKKVRSIGDTQYSDNIEASRKTFYEKDVIEFQIKIENIGNQRLDTVKVKDTLPKYLGLIFYPGSFNEKDNSVEWNIDRLEPGESRIYLIRARIQDSTKLSILTKQTNSVETKADTLGDSDTASYYIGNTIVPDTGAADVAVKTLLIVSIAASGFYFRKLARGY